MTARKSDNSSKTMKDLFQMELMDMYDAEQRIIRGLEKLAEAADAPEVKDAFQEHMRETQDDIKKLEQVFDSFGMKPKAKKCEGIVGVLEEGDEIASEFKGSPACDAALISAAQKVEHYEIASYGCLQEWAELLGNEEAAGILQEILDNEKTTDESLTELARASRNREAAEPAGVAAGTAWGEEEPSPSSETSGSTPKPSSSRRSKK
jgi:ferritin-like metal-binding protein YciE